MFGGPLLSKSPLFSTLFANLAVDKFLEGILKWIPTDEVRFFPIHHFPSLATTKSFSSFQSSRIPELSRGGKYIAVGSAVGCARLIDSRGRTIFIADAHRGDGKRFVVRTGEKLIAFLELESAIKG
jgi:hypothetical protein